MTPERWLLVAAGFNAAVALFHVAFWRLFRWKEDLPKLRAVNRGVLQVMNLMLIYAGLALAACQMALSAEWVGTALGRVALGGVVGFWLLRAALQPFFWPRTAASWAFMALCLLGALLHAAALFR
jgi:hypothetical protein